MNVQKLAKLFGIVFILIGILGFIPGVTTGNHLFGIFEVDVLHNIIHLGTGLIALWAMSTLANSRLFFKVFGVVYGAVTVLGLMATGGNVLGLITVNMADNLLNLVIAIVALYAGFGMKE